MKSARQTPLRNGVVDADASVVGVFYRCENSAGCGLRFPVTPTDPFDGRCPRCGGGVEDVAPIDSGMQEPSGPSNSTRTITSNLHLLLDNWRSVFNVGAAFRSADGAGVRHLYLCGITATPTSQSKLAKTALGAERAVTWSYHADAVKLVTELKSEGAQLWVLERNVRAQALFVINQVPSEYPVVLAAGNEVRGVDPGLVALADRVIQLPMFGVKDSLNVAVALSIATYWLRAQELSA
jgi:tRNA G18 (ribose-2'-O)-methylase SpoU